MPIDSVHHRAETPHPSPDPVRVLPCPGDADPDLCRECRQAHLRLLVHRSGLPVVGRSDPACEPDAPQPSPGLQLEDIELRLAQVARDDVASLHGVLWSCQRLAEQLIAEENSGRSTLPRQREAWRRLSELHRQLRRRLRSTARQTPR